MGVTAGWARRIPGEFLTILDKASKKAKGVYGPSDAVEIGQHVNVNFAIDARSNAGYSGEVVEKKGEPGRWRYRVVCKSYPPEVYDHWWPGHYCELPRRPPPFVMGPFKGGTKR